MHKKSFTLAELMIAVTVISVVVALVMPTLITAVDSYALPEVKAAKTYADIEKAIDIMINSGPYDVNDGNLDATYFIGGTSQASSNNRMRFFCTNLANVLNAKDVDCTMDKVNSYITIPDYYKTNGYIACPDGSGFTVEDNGGGSSRNPICIKKPYRTFDYPGVYMATTYIQDAFDKSCDNFYDNSTKDDYNIKTINNTLISLQLTNFSHNGIYGQETDYYLTHTTYFAKHYPAFFNVICIDTANHTSKSNMYALGINKQGMVIPGIKITDVDIRANWKNGYD